MPANARATAAPENGQQVGVTLHQSTLPFGHVDKLSTTTNGKQNKIPEGSPEDSPATVKRQRNMDVADGDNFNQSDAKANKENAVSRVAAAPVGEIERSARTGEYFDEEIEAVPKCEASEDSNDESGALGKRRAAGNGVAPRKQQKSNGLDDEPETGQLKAKVEASSPSTKQDSKGRKNGKKGGKGGRRTRGGKVTEPAVVEEAASPEEPKDEGPFLTLEEAFAGGRCIAYDPRDKKNYIAKIVSVDPDSRQALIHYLGWPSKWDHWSDIAKLKPVAKEPKLEIPVPQLLLKSVNAKSAELEAVVPEGAEHCPAYQVSLDGEESVVLSFAPDAGYAFTQRLPPASTLQVRLRLRGKNKQFDAGKWGAWSEPLEVTTAEEVKEEEGDGGRAAKQKALGEGFCTTVSATAGLSEEQKVEREQRRAVQFHDSFCAVCFGWEEQDRRLFCCDGGCRQSFHAQCLGLDDADMESDDWHCAACTAGLLKCLICHRPSKAQDMVVCSVHSCRKAFHASCLTAAGYAEPVADKALRCPQHECRSCGQEANLKGFCAKFIKCIRCADGFHDKCIPTVGHELFPDEVPLRMICNKHEADIKVLRNLKIQSSLEGAQLQNGPVILPQHDLFRTLVLKLQEQIPSRFRLPVQYAGARNYEGSKPAPFKLLQRNFYAMGRPRICKEDIALCSCSPDSKHKCSTLPASMLAKIPEGCGDSCENRLTCVECLASTCPLGDKCGNQRLQKRAYARLDLFKTNGRGWGLKALERIPAGALVQEYIGEVLSVGDFQARTARYNENTPVYFFNLDQELVIDASAMGSMARFINHSCGPNCHTEKWTVGNETRIGIFATDDIEAGEEVTYNYQFESFGGARHKCLCGSKNCSGELGKRPRTAKELEAELAALKKNKGRRKKPAAAAAETSAEADTAPPEPEITDPAEKMQGALVQIVRRSVGSVVAPAANVPEGADAAGEGAVEQDAGAVKMDVEGAAPTTSEDKGGADATVESEGTGEVLAVHGELALVRREGVEELRRAWLFTRGVVESREKAKQERASAGEDSKVSKSSRESRDPLAGLFAPMMSVMDVEWVPLADVVTVADQADEDSAEGEVRPESQVVGESSQHENGSPSKAVGASPSKACSFRITKVTDERLAEMETRGATEVKVQPAAGSLSRGDMERLCAGLTSLASLTRLDLDGALFGDDGCPPLAALITKSRTLHAVDVQYNGISDVGAKVLADAICGAEYKPSVQDLHLGRNSISAASAGLLARILQRCPTMSLLLSGNKLSAQEVEGIQQWHLSLGDIRGLLVDGDRARLKRSEQRRAAKEAAERAAAAKAAAAAAAAEEEAAEGEEEEEEEEVVSESVEQKEGEGGGEEAKESQGSDESAETVVKGEGGGSGGQETGDAAGPAKTDSELLAGSAPSHAEAATA